MNIYFSRVLKAWSFFDNYCDHRLWKLIPMVAFLSILDIVGLMSLVPIMLQIFNWGGDLAFDEQASLPIIGRLLNKDLDSTVLIFILLGIFLLKGCIAFFINYFRLSVSADFARSVRTSLVEMLGERDGRARDIRASGEFSNLLLDQTNRLEKGFNNYQGIFVQAIQVFLLCITISLINWLFMVLGLFTLLLLGMLFARLNRILVDQSCNLVKASSALGALCVEVINCISYLTATNQFQYMRKRLHDRGNVVVEASRRVAVYSSILPAFKEVIILSVAIAAGVFALSALMLDPAVIATSALILFRLVSSLVAFQKSIQTFFSRFGTYELISGILNEHDRDYSAKPTARLYSEAKRDFKIDSISMDNVSFGYSSSAIILSDISLEIGRGERIWLQGPSGCGKSSLVKLMVGLNEASAGTVYINNYDISNLDRNLYSDRVGYVTSKNSIFSGTVFENLFLKFEAGDLCHEKLEQARFLLNEVGLIAEIGARQDIFDLELQEGGMGLSSGQAQRLQVVRELLRDIDFLILDEANSALDFESQRLLLALLNNVEDITIVFVSHRHLDEFKIDRRIEVIDGRLSCINFFSGGPEHDGRCKSRS